MSDQVQEMKSVDPLAGSPAPRTRQVFNAAGHPEFDLKVQHRDPKTGDMVKEAHYVRKVSAKDGTTYEAPPRSGFIYNEKGELIADQNREKRMKAEEEKIAAEAKAKSDAEEAVKAKEAENQAIRQRIIDEAKKEAEDILAQARSGKGFSKPRVEEAKQA